MSTLYDLREMLSKQLEEYGRKGELSAAILERVDTLTHAIKNLDKVIECNENEYSNRSYNGGHSYARRRDSMGRYEGHSRNGELVGQLRDMMEDAPDDRTRQEFQRLISRMEQM